MTSGSSEKHGSKANTLALCWALGFLPHPSTGKTLKSFSFRELFFFLKLDEHFILAGNVVQETL